MGILKERLTSAVMNFLDKEKGSSSSLKYSQAERVTGKEEI